MIKRFGWLLVPFVFGFSYKKLCERAFIPLDSILFLERYRTYDSLFVNNQLYYFRAYLSRLVNFFFIFYFLFV